MHLRIIRRSNFANIAAMRFYEPLIIVLVASCLSAADDASGIPSYVKICHRSDRHLERCIKDSINSLAPYLRDGIPGLRLPPFEPFRIDELNSSVHTDSINFDVKYTNLSIYGMSQIVVNQVKIDTDTHKLDLEIGYPYLTLKTNFHIVGKILSLPMNGTGIGQLELRNEKAENSIQLEPYTNKETGDIHFNATVVVSDFHVAQGSVKLDQLFNGDEVMTNATNLYLNQNRQQLGAAIKPELERLISQEVQKILNQIFRTYPVKVLLPD